MKFLFINTGTISQNAGIVRCLGLGEQLVIAGHTVFILINDHPENRRQYGDKYLGINFIYSRSGTLYEQVDKFLKIFHLKDIDYIHCMGLGSSVFLPALLNKKLFRKKFKIVLDFEDRQVLLVAPSKKKTMEFYEKLAANNADTIVCASSDLVLFLNQKYGIKANYLPFAINNNLQVNKKSKPNKGNEITIGYIGSLIEVYKEQLILLINLVKKAEGEINLIIGGKGEFESSLIELTNNLDISIRVKFQGFIPDEKLNDFFSEVDVLVFYFPETEINRYRCPNKAFLYASTGLPIVASNFGEVKNLLTQYPKAIFFNNQDSVDDFLKCILIANKKTETIDVEFYKKNSWFTRTQEYLRVIK